MQNNRLTVTRGAGELVLAPPHSPLENTEGVGFPGLFDGLGRRVCLRQSGAVHRGAVGQPSSSSMAQAIMSLPPRNLSISLHLKRVQFKILWKAADQIFSNSPGKFTPSVFSAFTFCPCRQFRSLCRSGWVVCVGSKAAVNIWCPYILRTWH